MNISWMGSSGHQTLTIKFPTEDAMKNWAACLNSQRGEVVLQTGSNAIGSQVSSEYQAQDQVEAEPAGDLPMQERKYLNPIGTNKPLESEPDKEFSKSSRSDINQGLQRYSPSESHEVGTQPTDVFLPGFDSTGVHVKTDFEVRRCSIDATFSVTANCSTTYQALAEDIAPRLSRLTRSTVRNIDIRLQYRDEDGDLIVLQNDDDMKIAFVSGRESPGKGCSGVTKEIEVSLQLGGY
jgi:hypothetical protein